jgi:bacillithiol synthase
MYKAHGTSLDLSEKEIKNELQKHPECFSPNVILRGLYQETILPNIVFIGGGGETAYWLQLKDLFEHYAVPFPVLVLRNSFLLVEQKWQATIAKLGFTIEDFFLSEPELVNRLVARETDKKLKLNGTFTEAEQLYNVIKKQATTIDITLEKHVEALKMQTLHRLQELEKKMLRAEKRKFADQQRQIHTIKEQLFPGNGLQERKENLSYYYAKWGKEFIQQLYEHSLSLEQEFVIVQEK